MDNFKLLSIIAVRKTAINKEMYAQIKANSRTETQYDIVERINAVLEASRDVSEGYGAKKRQAALIAVKAILDSYKNEFSQSMTRIIVAWVSLCLLLIQWKF